MTLRDELNEANPTRLAPALQKLQLGEVLNTLLAGAETEGSTIGGAVTATSSQNSTTGAATQSGSYVQADVQTIATLANALKVSYNAAQVDIAALVALVNQLRTAALSVKRTTETGVTVTNNVAVLAAVPSSLMAVVASAGGSTGMKTLTVGPISGPGAILPAAGAAVWDGGLNVRFASADAVTTADFLYAKAADATASGLSQSLEG